MVNTTGTHGFLVRYATHGLSLIEGVVVLSMAGLFAVFTAPRYACANACYRADATVRRIVANLQLVPSAARQVVTPRQMTFYSGNHTDPLQGIQNLGGNAAHDDVDLTDAPCGVPIGSVGFNADAGLDNGGFVAITGGTALRRVVVDTDSRRATVQ